MVSTNPAVDLTMTAGLPYARRMRAVDAALIWPTLEDFEVRSQIRAGKTLLFPLLGDLRPFLTPSIEANDIVVDLELTGQDVRGLPAGYYDIILSDPGPIDARAQPLMRGKIKIGLLVTASFDE